jgi:hypothetical protein
MVKGPTPNSFLQKDINKEWILQHDVGHNHCSNFGQGKKGGIFKITQRWSSPMDKVPLT